MVTDIIHAGIDNGSIRMYACNCACGYHEHKIDFSWKNVTCKRCLNLIKKFKRVEKIDGVPIIMFGDKR